MKGLIFVAFRCPMNLLAQQSGSAAPPQLRGIQEKLQTGAGLGWALFIIAAACLVILGLLIRAFVLALRRRRRLVEEWSDFRRRLDRWGMDGGSRRLLQNMATDHTPGAPLSLIQNEETFERAVHEHLKPVCANGPSEQARREAEAVAELRATLGFERTEEARIQSSRQIGRGREVQLTWGGEDDSETSRAVVGEPREDFLPLVELAATETDLEGEEVHLLLFIGERGYGFETTVGEFNPADATCLLHHSVELRAAGARELHRVPVEKPAFFRAVSETPEVEREGTLIDLSAGGLGLMCPCYFEQDEEVIIDLRPADLLGEETAEEGMEKRSLTCSVVTAQRIEEERCRYHLEFLDLDGEARQFVRRLVRALEVRAEE